MHYVQGFGHGSQAFEVKLVNSDGFVQVVKHDVPSRKYPLTHDRHSVCAEHVKQGDIHLLH